VDPAAVGYTDAWQAPAGKTVEDVLITDYGSPGGVDDWACQVTSGALTASPNDASIETPATFCAPASTTPNPGTTSYALDVEFLQDPQVADGLSAYLFENDTKEAYYALGLAEEGTPPTSIGRCRLIAGNFGGAARDNLLSTLSLPVSRKPDNWYGDATAGKIVHGDGSASTPTPSVAADAASAKKDKVPANA
jgi:hypothetical protein